MATTTLSPEAILTTLTHIVHRHYGVDVVTLRMISGIELDRDTRHPHLTDVQTELAWDPPRDTSTISNADKRAPGW